ncbi:phosphoglucomutase-2 [Hyalella azteca]|uniref:Phosphoglucomutase-2 n=1 Tax=Hyalella azteca TaxID=294128 RepID=A0A8B7NMC4_HYAAZ|nr:phosphoglucomutase-2 [Hyalella azteca]
MEGLPSNIRSKVEEWLQWDQNSSTRQEVEELVAQKKHKVLEGLLLSRLVFGTAGLRARMGAGYSQLNDLVIIQTSQGLVKYLLEVEPDAAKRGIVIGHDSRHNSHRFARLAASAFLLGGVNVYLLGDICPTPFVPFTVKQLGAAAGVMVTASHNPKEDNGYKVYWSNSAQIIPPHDSGIQESIEQHLQPWPGVWDTQAAEQHERLSDPLDRMAPLYYQALASSMLDVALNGTTPLRFTVTAMHGVGHRYMKEAFKACGFKDFVPVVEQMEPDPDFPTVRFPNPEEGKSALDLSFRAADAADSSIILANDPDADRLALATKQDGAWKVFTGNEEGALLGWWTWQRHKQRSPHTPPEDVYMIASTVSSKILRAIANKEGFNFIETLTGFKWMGNEAVKLLSENKTVLFAFEEAIGFMAGVEVLDKDGVSAGVYMAELASHLHTKGLTLLQQLQIIYQMYGYHASRNSYFICHDALKIKAIFERIRNFSGPKTYPESVCGGKFAVSAVRDLTTGYDSSQADGRAMLPSSSSSQMITFSFSNGCVVTLRTSGTEPKIKYYSEICAKPEQSDWAALEAELELLVSAVVEELLQPQFNELIPKAD